MKVKLEWLNELVDIEGLSLEDIVNGLSLHSTEVEYASKIIEATNLVVGYVKECKKHENSDHLSVCLVDVGNSLEQIICGAPNVRAGQYVIVALPGAVLPNGLKIKKTKIRQVESNGMICSLLELGVEKKYLDEENLSGIYVFKEKVDVGMDALVALNLADHVIELDITPNRGDLLSMLGVALEVSAVFNRGLKPLAFKIVEETELGKLEVINESDECIGYYGKLFKDVEIKQSPMWLISRLIAFGIRPINNVVDITNYILALFGQPLHAFDYDKLGSKIIIRNAKENEEIVTLDNVKRKLIKDDIVITDGKKPVAIAGVMGGLDTEITESTTNLVIEAASFSKTSVRNTSLRLGLRSDSSIRFEKGVDINRTKFALDYTSYLLNKYANAKVGKTIFDGRLNDEQIVIKITPEEVNKVLGINIGASEIKTILERLKFSVSNDLEVKVPTRRSDIVIKEDLIEEIARIYGYKHLPSRLPSTRSIGELNKKQIVTRLIRNTLFGLGLNENITYSLVSENDNKLFTILHQDNSKDVELLMPLSQDRTVLRKSLIPSLIESVKYSYNRQLKDLGIFEIGRVYYDLESNQEEEHLGILLSNYYSKSLAHFEKVDFYLLKGILEELFNKLELDVKFVPLSKVSNELHPNMSAELYLDSTLIGYVGKLHPKYANLNDLDDVYVAEIRLTNIFNFEKEEFKFVPISRVPSVERDIAVVVKKDILAGDMIDTIKNIKNINLYDVNIFDVYTGENVKGDEMSIAINLIFSSNETMTEELINKQIDKILKELQTKFNASLRK